MLGELTRTLPRTTTFVAATTGLAACHVGGTTLNAFAGIGTGSAPVDQLLPQVKPPQALLSCTR